MAIGRLEPLYRYLRLINMEDAVSSIVGHMEELAQGGYIECISEGIHETRDTTDIQTEIQKELAKACGVTSDTFLHTTVQSIKDSLYISIARVSEECSKTCLSVVLKDDGSAVVEYAEPNAFHRFARPNKPYYTAVNAAIELEDGSIKRGFIRYHTTYMKSRRDANRLAIKIDFDMTRAAPIYLHISNLNERVPILTIGTPAKELYASMEAEWTA